MRQALRPYQQLAIERVRTAMRSHRSVLLVAPTGAGKTSVAAEMIHGAIAKGSAVLFLAHRKELIDQCSRRLDEWGVDHGVIQAQHYRTRPEMLVQVGSVQSVRNRLRTGVLAPTAKLIVVDESHRALAKTYVEIIKAHPGAWVIGLTATPIRQDGRGLGSLYAELVLVAQPGELVRDGYLLEPTIYAGSVGDLSGVHSQGGEYVPRELAAAMDKPRLVGDVVENHARIVGRGKRTVVFATSVEHSQHLTAAFCEAGVPAAHLDGTTEATLRDATLARLRSGELEMVSNMGILTEGWDLPALDAAVLARPTRSLGLYMQMIGRVLRPSQGKERALVLDHGGNVHRHGWPTADREWCLDAGIKAAAKAEPSLKNCPKCGRIALSTAKQCEGCSFVWTKAEPEPIAVVQADLRQVSAKDVPKPGVASRDVQQLAEAVGRALAMKSPKLGRDGFPGFAAHRFFELRGRWPSPAEKREALARAKSMFARGEP